MSIDNLLIIITTKEFVFFRSEELVLGVEVKEMVSAVAYKGVEL